MANSIRMRANLEGDVTTVRALISHPMETGMMKNKKTGDLIPAHFIQEVVCEHNGNTVHDQPLGTGHFHQSLPVVPFLRAPRRAIP
jgi:thiosulfate oxidation carrier complex protein SoxZ